MPARSTVSSVPASVPAGVAARGIAGVAAASAASKRSRVQPARRASFASLKVLRPSTRRTRRQRSGPSSARAAQPDRHRAHRRRSRSGSAKPCERSQQIGRQARPSAVRHRDHGTDPCRAEGMEIELALDDDHACSAVLGQVSQTVKGARAAPGHPPEDLAIADRAELVV